MSPRSRKEYIEAVFLRYKKATRPQKKAILDEFCINTTIGTKIYIFKENTPHRWLYFCNSCIGFNNKSFFALCRSRKKSSDSKN